MVQGVVGVDPHGTCTEGIRNLNSRVEVAGVHGSCETVSGGVAEANGILLGGEFGDGADGAEDFLLHDLHIFRDFAENGGLDEVTLLALALAADFDLGTGFFAGVDVAASQVSFVLLCCVPRV